MKIFVAGARSIKVLGPSVEKRLKNIYDKDYEILVGDCYGVDASVQKFYKDLKYNNVVVYASNGRARNNLGHWKVENISVPLSVKGFDFYKQKDMAMVRDADYGFMIWDGKSKGTLNNMINLISQNKVVLLYLTTCKKMFSVKKIGELENIVISLEKSTQKTFRTLVPKRETNYKVSRFEAGEQLNLPI